MALFKKTVKTEQTEDFEKKKQEILKQLDTLEKTQQAKTEREQVTIEPKTTIPKLDVADDPLEDYIQRYAQLERERMMVLLAILERK